MTLEQKEELYLLYTRLELLEKEIAMKDDLIALLKETNTVMECYIDDLLQQIEELQNQRKDG